MHTSHTNLQVDSKIMQGECLHRYVSACKTLATPEVSGDPQAGVSFASLFASQCAHVQADAPEVFWIFRRPFGPIAADIRVSRRDSWICVGRVRPRFAPRGPGVIWEPFSEVGVLGSHL